jgi:PhnB protein
MMAYGESPAAGMVPEDWGKKIIHGTISISGHTLTGADVPPDRYQRPQGFSVLLNVEDADHAARIFAALSDGGIVQMGLQETFWAARFGMLVDRFGIPWMVNCEKQPQ